MLATKAGKEAYVEPVIDGDRYRFVVKVGKPKDTGATKSSKLAGSNFRCLFSGAPISGDYIKSEGQAGRISTRMMAMVTEGQRGRIFLSPTLEMEAIACKARPDWRPQGDVPAHLTGGTCVPYGLREWGDLFTFRQLAALTTFSDLIHEVREQVRLDALSGAMVDDGVSLEAGGVGAVGYADAIAVYLACLLDRMIYYGSSLTTWLPKDNALRDCMPRQGLAMVWDFAGGNPFGKSSGDVMTCANSIANYLDLATPRNIATVTQCDARTISGNGKRFLFCTDPPYYNNISYADLSDYFYVWLRRPLKALFPDLFATLTIPKTEELVASRIGTEAKRRPMRFSWAV